MDLKTLACPECGSSLEVENGLDTFYCKYCGSKIYLSGMSEGAYRARDNEAARKHEERMLDKEQGQELRMIKERRKLARTQAFNKFIENKDAPVLLVFGGLLIILNLFLFVVLPLMTKR